MTEHDHAERELSDPTQGSSYRWMILAVAFLVHATAIALIWQSIPPLKKAIAPTLGTGWETAVIIYSAFSFGMMFTQLPGGALGDRYPLRYVVGLGGILAGAATMLRIAVPSLLGQVVISVIATIGMGLVNPNLIKVVTDWFPAHQLGLGQGILLSGNTLASGLALSLSAGVVLSALGSWQLVFILYGGLTVLTGVLWLVFVRGPRDEERPIDPDTGVPFETGESIPLRQSISEVMRAPSTKWAIATAAVAFWAILGSLSVIPEFADMQPYDVPELVLGVPLYLGTVGALSLPVLSDRFGRAPLLKAGAIGLATGIVIIGFAPSLSVFVLGMVVSGFFGGGLNAMFYVLPGSLTDIKPAHVGTMSGVILSLANIGAVASTAASAQVLSAYGIQVAALFVALPPLLGLYFITKLRL